MSFTMRDSVRAGAHELGEQWTVDRHLYLTEDRKRVVEEGDPEGRWLWAPPGHQVPLAQAKQLGAIRDEDAEQPADEETTEDPEEKQAAPAENKMLTPEDNKAEPAKKRTTASRAKAKPADSGA